MNIVEELEQCENLRRRIKWQSMQYQFDLKNEVADYYGLTYNEVNLPYEQWASIRNIYLEQKRKGQSHD